MFWIDVIFVIWEGAMQVACQAKRSIEVQIEELTFEFGDVIVVVIRKSGGLYRFLFPSCSVYTTTPCLRRPMLCKIQIVYIYIWLRKVGSPFLRCLLYSEQTSPSSMDCIRLACSRIRGFSNLGREMVDRCIDASYQKSPVSRYH